MAASEFNRLLRTPQIPDLARILSSCNEGVKFSGINRVQVEKYIEFNLPGNYSVPALYI
jgi:hypothetical protein